MSLLQRCRYLLSRSHKDIAPSASLPATRLQFGLGAVLQCSITPSLRAAGFEDEDDDEDENEAPGESIAVI
jgi:hypothetical protein